MTGSSSSETTKDSGRRLERRPRNTVPTQLLMESALGNTVGPSGIPGADFSEYATQLGASGIIYNNTGVAVAPGCGSTGR